MLSSTSISKFISEHPCLAMLETRCSTIDDVKMVHAHLIKTGLIKDKIAASRVLALSATCDVSYAYLVFRKIDDRNLFMWNTIIRGFSNSSFPEVAISMFIEMLEVSSVQPDRLTYPSLFKACARLGFGDEGGQLYGRMVKSGLDFDPFIRNAALNMYVSCGLLSEAWNLFDEDEVDDVVAWNSMVSGLGKCGEIEEAQRLFDKMPQRNNVSWNGMISSCVKNGKWMEALELFNEMQESGFRPNEYTLVSLLNASAFLGALEQGKWIHEYIVRTNSFKINGILITALINMYCKCGEIEMARQVFDSAKEKALSCWNSMIFGLGINGFGHEAINLFSMLLSSKNLKPDHVTFSSVLTACNHSGLVDEARAYFTLMKDAYNIEPSVQHFGCIVDTLGRAGLLEEAEEIIRNMPAYIKPDGFIWGSLLSSARSHGNPEMAQRAAEFLVELDQNDSSGHLLMSNAHAASGHFAKAVQERILMKEKRLTKQPGCSSIEVDGEVHEFVAGGVMHDNVNEIYSLLN